MFYDVELVEDETEAGAALWLATSPVFPEVTTSGDTPAEVLASVGKAIEEAISARMSDGEDVPVPRSERSASVFVEISALTFLKIALYTTCRSKQVTRAELARRLGWHREQVDRLFRLDHRSQLDQLEAAFKALGESIQFSMPKMADAA